jgi:hypothetical protein
MDQEAFQDFYPDGVAQCYGCGGSTNMVFRSRAIGTATNRCAPSTPSPITPRSLALYMAG